MRALARYFYDEPIRNGGERKNAFKYLLNWFECTRRMKHQIGRVCCGKWRCIGGTYVSFVYVRAIIWCEYILLIKIELQTETITNEH